MRVRHLLMALAATAAMMLSPGKTLAGTGVDSLSVEEILKRRNALLDSLLTTESRDLDTVGVSALLERIAADPSILDSLDRAHDGPPRAVRFGITPLALTSFNRVEGLRTGIGFRLDGPGGFHSDGAAAYGISNHRWTGIGGAGLKIGRNGPRIRIEGQDRVEPFGPNRNIREGMGFLAFVAGQDRRDYLRRRGGRLIVDPYRTRSADSRVTAFHYEDLPVASSTDFSLVDGDPIHEPNPETDRGRTRGVSVSGSVSIREDVARFQVEAGVVGGELGGDFDYSWQTGTATLRPVFPDGGILNLSVTATNTGGAPPVQSRPFLGGEANLRGYRRLEFVGKQVVSGRVEYETGIDILERSGVPILEKLHLQFIPFADFGSTWGRATGVEKTAGTLEGSVKASVGIGIQRDLWLPGARAIRLDVIRRMDGSKDPWSVWFRIVPMP